MSYHRPIPHNATALPAIPIIAPIPASDGLSARDEPRMSGRARLAILFGGSAILWTGIALLIRAAL